MSHAGRLKPPSTPRLADPDAERVRRAHEERIIELQGVPAMDLRVMSDIELADGVVTAIPHSLGRVPTWVSASCPRGAPTTNGRIEEVRSSTHKRNQFVVLKATGWGVTITVDVAVL